MTLEEAIQEMQSKISAACAVAEMKVTKMSDEEARIEIEAGCGHCPDQMLGQETGWDDCGKV
jgi:hypothetical protein